MLGRAPDDLRGALRRAVRPQQPHAEAHGRVSFEDVELWDLPGAGDFSDDPALCNPAALIAEFRRHPASQLLTELLDAGSHEFYSWSGRSPGRPPLEGDWAALYLGYVADGAVAIQRFANKLAGTGLLEACGFGAVPSRQSIDRHFALLEEQVAAFDEVGREIIRRGMQVESQIGVVVFVDSTGFHSASALEHACTDMAACLRASGKRGGWQPKKATEGEVLEQHFRETDSVEPSLDNDEPVGSRTRGAIVTRMTLRGPTQYQEIFINGHRCLTRDLSSGVRWYRDTDKFWLGGYAQAAVDMYTGLPLAFSVFPADVNEWDGYPPLFEALDLIGRRPKIVSVDRGFVNGPFYEFHARRGVGVVAGWRNRKHNESVAERRTDAFDEHGVPRCRFCGGPGDTLTGRYGPALDSEGEPVIRFRCLVPRTDDCAKRDQLIACSADYVQLPLLSRETEIYHAVRHSHHNKENQFHHYRRRYATTGKEGLGRICRSGVEVQRLRLSAARLLDWFKASLRHGWLEPVGLDVTRNTHAPRLRSARHDHANERLISPGIGAQRLDKLLSYRDEHQLDLPYGPAAQRLQCAYQEVR